MIYATYRAAAQVSLTMNRNLSLREQDVVCFAPKRSAPGAETWVVKLERAANPESCERIPMGRVA